MEVEVWSDVACPWCYVGKRHLEQALTEFEGADDVQVTWRSFELDPTAPRVRGQDAVTLLAAKYGRSHEEAEAMVQSMRETGARDGLDLRFDIARSGNTFDAHRLLHLAASQGMQDAVKERFMRAYQTEGEAIGEPEVLQRLAEEAGLPADEVREVLITERFAEEVRADEAQAVEFGIRGVPFFVVDRRVAVSGAQPPEVLLQLLQQGAEAEAA